MQRIVQGSEQTHWRTRTSGSTSFDEMRSPVASRRQVYDAGDGGPLRAALR